MSSNLFENTDTILSEERIFPPTNEMVANANITAYMKSKGFDDYESIPAAGVIRERRRPRSYVKPLHQPGYASRLDLALVLQERCRSDR